MADYKKMYAILCKAIDDAIDPLEQIPSAIEIKVALQNALYEAEELYITTSLYRENKENLNVFEPELKIDNQ